MINDVLTELGRGTRRWSITTPQQHQQLTTSVAVGSSARRRCRSPVASTASTIGLAEQGIVSLVAGNTAAVAVVNNQRLQAESTADALAIPSAGIALTELGRGLPRYAFVTPQQCQ